MPSRYSSYDDYDYDASYQTSRTGRQPLRTKVVEIPDDRIEFIRKRELASFYGEPEKSLVLRKDDSEDEEAVDDRDNSRQMVRTQRSTNDTASYSRGNDDYYRRSSQRDSYSQSSGRRRPRAQSEGGRNSQYQQDRQLRQVQTQGQNGGQSQSRGQGRARGQGQEQDQDQGDSSQQPRRMKIPMNKSKMEEGQLRQMCHNRKDGTWAERHFDSSLDGLLAAGAGAAIGAITVRRFRPVTQSPEEMHANVKSNRVKMIGGALVGALALNAGENQFRIWAEEHSEFKEAIGTGGELCCEGLDNFPIA